MLSPFKQAQNHPKQSKVYQFITQKFHATFSSRAPSSLRICLFFLLACLASFVGILTTRQAFCTFENPQRIEFEKYWYAEVPVPQLFIGSPVSYFGEIVD
jgi:hypothetical protein